MQPIGERRCSFMIFFSSGECAVVGRVCSHREGVQLCGECAVRFGCVQSARRVCSEVFSWSESVQLGLVDKDKLRNLVVFE